MAKKILTGLLIALVLIQFFRGPKNDGAALGAQDVTTLVATPDTVLHLLQTSCFDCHSNHTNYPWYAEINPIGWWIAHDVKEGKQHLNFSAPKPKKLAHKLDETIDELNSGEMPPAYYCALHPKARLTEAQKHLITEWASRSMNQIKTQP